MKKIITFVFIILATVAFFGQSKTQTISKPTEVFLMPYRVGKMWGLADTLGNIKIQPKFEKIPEFRHYYDKKNKKITSYFVVYNGAKYFAVDHTGEEVFKKQNGYDSISLSYTKTNIFKVYKNHKTGVFMNGKEVIPCIYNDINHWDNLSFRVVKGQNTGLINSHGKWVIPLSVGDVSFKGYKNNKAIWVRYIVNEDGESHEIKTYTDTAIKGEEEEYAGFPVKSMIDVEQKETEEDLKEKYDVVIKAVKHRAIYFVEKNGKVGAYNLELGKEIIAPFYDKMTDLGYYYLKTKQKNLYGAIDLKGNKVLEPQYDFLEDTYYDISFMKDHLCGIYIAKTKKMIFPKYPNMIEHKETIYCGKTEFSIYELNENSYIGQNGVEFFKN